MKTSRARVTERRNPASRNLDQLPTLQILQRMNREDARVATAVKREIPRIAKAVDAIVRAIESGGRLIYVGAGTSGRLALIDAAECPPTFGVAPEVVRAVIAGGERALRGAVEGAEDDAAAGAREMRTLRASNRDVVVGIAASGETPFVLGALREAEKRGAVTIGLTSNSHSALACEARIAIVSNTGSEIIAGSTRLKAGTAQKIVLNMLSTAAMIRLGHVYDNWMIDMALTNKKLRQRAVRILVEATGASAAEATRALQKSANETSVALVMLKCGVGADDAQQRLAANGGNIRAALNETLSGARGHKTKG